ncbi:hypothetical protein PFISCL1PPCAC_6599, partial [Pristionchus fissidentatus]
IAIPRYSLHDVAPSCFMHLRVEAADRYVTAKLDEAIHVFCLIGVWKRGEKEHWDPIIICVMQKTVPCQRVRDYTHEILMELRIPLNDIGKIS